MFVSLCRAIPLGPLPSDPLISVNLLFCQLTNKPDFLLNIVLIEDSLKMEMFGFLGKDAEEGLFALKKKIAPTFPSAHLYWNQPD